MSDPNVNRDYVDEASGTIRSKNTYSGVCHSNPQTYGGGEIHLPERQGTFKLLFFNRSPQVLGIRDVDLLI